MSAHNSTTVRFRSAVCTVTVTQGRRAWHPDGPVTLAHIDERAGEYSGCDAIVRRADGSGGVEGVGFEGSHDDRERYDLNMARRAALARAARRWPAVAAALA